MSISNFERLPREALPVLPDPVGIDGRDFARSCRRHMCDHRERNVEVIIGVRAPGQTPRLTNLCHTHGALHRPKMWICQRYVDGLKLDRMAQLPPVGCD